MHRIALVFVVLPLALAACSGTESRVAQQLTPTASVRQAANKTTAATSAHVTFNASGALRRARTSSLTGSGDFDNANHRGSFHLDVPEYGSFDLILDGNTAYVKRSFPEDVPAGGEDVAEARREDAQQRARRSRFRRIRTRRSTA